MFSTLSGTTISVPKFGPEKFRSLNISPVFQHFSGLKFRSQISVSKWSYFQCFLHFFMPLISVPNFGPQKFRSRISVPKISVPIFGPVCGAISGPSETDSGRPPNNPHISGPPKTNFGPQISVLPVPPTAHPPRSCHPPTPLHLTLHLPSAPPRPVGPSIP